MHGVEVNDKAYAGGGADAVVQAVAVCADLGHGSVVASTENLGTTDVRQTGKVVGSDRHQDAIPTEEWDLVGYFLCAAN